MFKSSKALYVLISSCYVAKCPKESKKHFLSETHNEFLVLVYTKQCLMLFARADCLALRAEQDGFGV